MKSHQTTEIGKGSSGLSVDHDFYKHLVDYLNPAYSIPTTPCSDLKSASYAYFKALVTFDGIIDHSVSPLLFFDGLKNVENSIKLLSKYFPYHHLFWEEFEQCKSLYFETLQIEKKYSTTKHLFSEKDFNKIAKGKSAVCYAIVHALSHLATIDERKNKRLTNNLITCLEEIHIAFQCKDDIDDFYADLEGGQHTYAHTLTLQSFEKEESANSSPSSDFLHRYFYISGQAQWLIAKAISHLERAKLIAERYHLRELCVFVDQEVAMAHSQMHEIQLLIDKTKSKAAQATKTIARSTEGSKSVIEEAVTASSNFISDSFGSDHTLSDFMTGAGLGKGWISSYCAFLTAGHHQASKIADRLKRCDELATLSVSQASYNTSIVQDADSMSFGLAARKMLFNKVDTNDLDEWKKFQHKGGGWRTYVDAPTLRQQIKLDDGIGLQGWTAPHNCVSASTCAILSLFPEQKDAYYRTAEFLSKQVQANGSLPSYWWSSAIYATSWLIVAFSKDDLLHSECLQSVEWLLKQQTENGSWVDDLSGKESAFYTALATKALLSIGAEKHQHAIEKGVSFLLKNQMTDGSWKAGRILAIPQTDALKQEQVRKWRKSSFGVNTLVDDHKRVFTSVTVLNLLMTRLSSK